MQKIGYKKFDLPEMFIEQAEGNGEWYLGSYFPEDTLDLYEVEYLYQEGKNFSGNQIYFIHYPKGEVYTPFPLEEGVYYEKPVWGKDDFGILKVDFIQKKISIYSYKPKQELQLLYQMPLGDIKDCYNLKLDGFPWTLGREEGDCYEMIWPIHKSFSHPGNESFLCRQEDILYFWGWVEDPHYHEYLIGREMTTGKELFVEKGSLYRMPNGELWKI